MIEQKALGPHWVSSVWQWPSSHCDTDSDPRSDRFLMDQLTDTGSRTIKGKAAVNGEVLSGMKFSHAADKAAAQTFMQAYDDMKAVMKMTRENSDVLYHFEKNEGKLLDSDGVSWSWPRSNPEPCVGRKKSRNSRTRRGCRLRSLRPWEAARSRILNRKKERSHRNLTAEQPLSIYGSRFFQTQVSNHANIGTSIFQTQIP